MKQPRTLLICLALLSVLPQTYAQHEMRVLRSEEEIEKPVAELQLGGALKAEEPKAVEYPDPQDDPAYSVYKAGYNLVLDEEWKDRKSVV